MLDVIFEIKLYLRFKNFQSDQLIAYIYNFAYSLLYPFIIVHLMSSYSNSAPCRILNVSQHTFFFRPPSSSHTETLLLIVIYYVLNHMRIMVQQPKRGKKGVFASAMRFRLRCFIPSHWLG